MTTQKHSRIRRHLVLLLALVLVAGGCAFVKLFTAPQAGAPRKRRPRLVSTFNHLIHIESGSECSECHEGAESENAAGLPDVESCENCHDLEEEGAFSEYLQSEPKKDDKPVISRKRRRGFNDVIAPHGTHSDAGLSCSDCHGDIAESEKIMENTILGKEMCMDCHEGERDCAKCHKTIRKTTKPWTHYTEWRPAHGGKAFPRPGVRNERCFLCHDEPSCRNCHRSTKPASHAASWKRFHGADVDLQFELLDNRCFFCHKRNDCKSCHATETPSSHTASWRTRTHGLHAEMERDTCMVCHNQGYCSRCHRAAPPQPRDGAHAGGADCGTCHAFLDHGFRSTENFECAKCHK
jgi:hypothetical protein